MAINNDASDTEKIQDASGTEDIQDASRIEGIQKALQVLGVLKGLPAGHIIYQQVEEILQDLEVSFTLIERTYGTLIYALLDAYLSHLSPGSPIYIQVKLLQRRLQPPILTSELESMKVQVELYADYIARMQVLDVERFSEMLSPLLGNLESGEKADIQTEFPDKTDAEDGSKLDRLPSNIDLKTPSVNIDKPVIQASGLETTITDSQEFGAIIDAITASLQQAEDANDIAQLRNKLLSQARNLHDTYHGMVEKLFSAYRSISGLENDRKNIDIELTKARLMCMLDEVTELPNHRAFIQNVEDEVGRVQRHSQPLSLAIIELDGLEVISNQFGQEAGNKVMRGYVSRVFSLFRKYDTVCRYGGSQFAMLLPNTDKSGAVAALNKARNRVSGDDAGHDSAEFQMPMFNAGMAIYRNGDTASTFIERADHALYRVRTREEDWLEINIH